MPKHFIYDRNGNLVDTVDTREIVDAVAERKRNVQRFADQKFRDWLTTQGATPPEIEWIVMYHRWLVLPSGKRTAVTAKAQQIYQAAAARELAIDELAANRGDNDAIDREPLE